MRRALAFDRPLMIKLPSPKLPDYDIAAWQKRPFPERLRSACQSWAVDGYGTPPLVYFVYLLKIGLYVGAWLFFCAQSDTLGRPGSIASWWHRPEALERAVIWSMAFEGLGLGCGSGPLTGRYFPPLGGFLYFARPGTLKLSLFPRLPLLGGERRTLVDVGLYVAHLALLFRALMAREIAPELLLPTVLLFPVLSVADKTLFLASRGEHFFTAILCFMVPVDLLAGSKLLWIAIWMWAATSKLNRHFPAVVCVMTSNSASLRSRWLRERLYVDYPNDLRPSKLAHAMAHTGTLTELAFPIVLAVSHGGWPTLVGLVVMLGFHVFITSNLPMGVPIEWNVVMVYGAFVLFGAHAEVRAWDLHSMPLALALAFALVVVPFVGNFFPKVVSFLPAMRYYAGNWAYGIWLFRGDSVRKLDAIVKSARMVDDQLRMFYDEPTTVATLSKVMAFRAMHIHGRALHDLVPKAVDDVDAYRWYDGEIVAGVVLGWNFGDGHLHNERLLGAVQRACGFEPGELRCIFVESQPMLQPHMDYRIVDANTGEIERGRLSVDVMLERQPWPT